MNSRNHSCYSITNTATILVEHAEKKMAKPKKWETPAFLLAILAALTSSKGERWLRLIKILVILGLLLASLAIFATQFDDEVKPGLVSITFAEPLISTQLFRPLLPLSFIYKIYSIFF
jgi:hypothetical protein